MFFCTGCGSPLKLGSGFCTKCGRAVSAAPLPGAAAPASTQWPGRAAAAGARARNLPRGVKVGLSGLAMIVYSLILGFTPHLSLPSIPSIHWPRPPAKTLTDDRIDPFEEEKKITARQDADLLRLINEIRKKGSGG